jgi:hypothetical protein
MWRGPAQRFPFRAGVPQPSPHTFHHQRTFQFSNSAQDGEHQLAGGSAGIELLGERNELDALGLEGFECPE